MDGQVMKTCKDCGKGIPCRVKINDKIVSTQRRKYCYECSPFGSGNNHLLKGNKTDEQKKAILDLRKKKRSKVVYQFQKIWRRKRKDKLLQELGGKCSKCDYNKSMWSLEFHHQDPNTKKFCLSVFGYTCSWEKLIEEAKKCVILCANCHRETEEQLSHLGEAGAHVGLKS
jgi:hypothetical protein